jgi:ribosomal-protein-alanine N-acetyltransferase
MTQPPSVAVAPVRLTLSGPPVKVCFRRLTPRYAHELVSFLGRLADAGDDRLFHPHPFTADVVATIAAPGGRDEYVVVTAGREGPVVAYGMLRGWDEGFAVPSLGIAVDRQWRGCGLGRRLVSQLHAVAVRRTAPAVRLKVYRSNTAAVALYRSFGYEFQPHPHDQWLGLLTLPIRRSRAA